jgi:hypothetical protein
MIASYPFLHHGLQIYTVACRRALWAEIVVRKVFGWMNTTKRRHSSMCFWGDHVKLNLHVNRCPNRPSPRACRHE